MSLRVLVACEFSGIVRDAFRALGHEAWSCDLLPTEQPGPHFQGCALEVLRHRGPFDVLIAHPPCTYLANSGVRWLYTGGRGDVRDEERWQLMRDFFLRLLDSDVPHVCVENPVQHHHAALPPFTQSIQPWQFGHPETKRTCLWLRGLSPLTPTKIVSGRKPRVHHASPSPDRWKERSRTLPGIATAMAEQFSRQILFPKSEPASSRNTLTHG